MLRPVSRTPLASCCWKLELVARKRGRSSGTPMPYAVKNSASGTGYTLGREDPTLCIGDMLESITTGLRLTFCSMLGKPSCS